MLVVNKQLLLSLLIGTSCIAAPKSLFEEMIEEVNEIQARFERRMNRVHEEMKKAMDAPLNNGIDTPILAINENKMNNEVEITLHPLAIKEKSIDASMDHDTNAMIITTPSGSLHLQTNRHILYAGFTHQLKQELDQKGNKAQALMSSYSQNAKTLSSELALEESHIEYDQTAQKLMVSIPFRKKLVTKIPVTIKEVSKAEEK